MALPTIKVLLIEDDPEDVEYILKLLSHVSGVRFQVETVERLSTGISQAAKDKPDVVLLDLSLPDSHGLDTVLRAREAFSQLPFLALTGIDDEATGIRAVQEGAQDYLLKNQIQSSWITRAIRYAIERKRTTEETAALRQREALHREFVTNVSHELRTPLTAIKASIETLRRGGMANAKKRQHFITVVERQVDRLSGLVEELLTLAGLESDSIQIEPNELDLGQHVRDCVEDFAAEASALGVSLNIESLDPLKVWADPKHLSQALWNLTKNALRHNRMDGSVKFSGRILGDEVQMTLHNTGVEISNEELSLIFTPFHGARFAASKGIAGTGLGLSIAKKAIELNGGRLWVESETGKGTFFHFTLPRIKKNGTRGIP